MKTKIYILRAVLAAMTAALVCVSTCSAQDDSARFIRKSMDGPRLGLTYVPTGNNLYKGLKMDGMSNTISQFGWHFEWQVVPKGGGPSFLIEFIPLLGAVEYGKVLPSLTLGLGIRMPSGFEFGMGPNLLLSGTRKPSTALMATVGKNFDFSGVSIPLNFVYVRNTSGDRYAIIFGYAIGS